MGRSNATSLTPVPAAPPAAHLSRPLEESRAPGARVLHDVVVVLGHNACNDVPGKVFRLQGASCATGPGTTSSGPRCSSRCGQRIACLCWICSSACDMSWTDKDHNELARELIPDSPAGPARVVSADDRGLRRRGATAPGALVHRRAAASGWRPVRRSSTSAWTSCSWTPRNGPGASTTMT